MFPASLARKNMKKPLLAVLGLAGACAACCSIPLVLTLVSGLSAAGVATWIVGSQTAQLAVVGVGAVLLVGGVGVWRARRARANCDGVQGSSCAIDPAAGCGCTTSSGQART
jgi:threonine/homoserine/homoserine lactone efflux protein